MLNPIKEIVKWQRDAGNAAKPYDDFLESSFQIEEALEGLHPEFIIASLHSTMQEEFNGCANSPKDVARYLTSIAVTSDLDFIFYDTKAILPESPKWTDTYWCKSLQDAIKNDYKYIRDGEGYFFEINDINSVTSLGKTPPITDVDRLDKACDAIVFAIGSMTKLGLDHHAITKALNIVNDANKAKLGMSRDNEGKLLKPEGFVGPEVKLQELLDGIRK